MGIIRPLLLAAVLALCGTGRAAAEIVTGLSHVVVGGRFEYVVQPGESLARLEARFGESAAEIAQNNSLDPKAHIMPGQSLLIEDLHVVPETLENGILINLPQRMLFFFRDGALEGAYPVGLGKPTWPTPDKAFSVIQLSKNPIWFVPLSIQQEMRESGQTVLTRVEPGPQNPLGKYWIGLSLPGYGIHSTNAPLSVYHFRSHGCIRLQPQHAEELFQRVKVNEPGKIIYAPVLLAVLNDGRIYLEVNPDIYGKGMDALKILRELAEENQLTDRVDWKKAAQVVEQQAGLARQISLQPDVDVPEAVKEPDTATGQDSAP